MSDFFRQLNQIFGGVPLQQQIPEYGGFHQTFRCYPVTLLDRQDTEVLSSGGKIILPPSALERMSQLNLQYPLLFQLTNHEFTNRKVHCGVLDFTAEEGRVYLPFWMMQNLGVDVGQFIKVRTVSLPLGTFVKLQPQSKSFLEIANPKAALERLLRHYAALGVGETIMIIYNKKEYYLTVLEVQPPSPSRAVSIIETDMNLEFAPPADEQEQELLNPNSNTTQSSSSTTQSSTSTPNQQIPPTKKKLIADDDSDQERDQGQFKPFAGKGVSISGKTPPISLSSSPVAIGSPTRAMNQPIPSPSHYHSSTPPTASKLRIGGNDSDSEEEEDPKKKQKFVAFSGAGYSLKGKK